ncbi:hypothetical protein [Lactococcus petauri]|uniref:hypothetical protein n=1 Tax=Lactococcus petauri TaxID=1940789 RepID=UPI0018A93B49|nr:hypothetical protein [Lactococcus petauri]MDC0825480.1 hypothetical protein [Lactococcus petauri]
MDFSNILFTLEFDDDGANSSANHFLSKGWKLISVGTKLIDILDNNQAYYNTAYVVGATKEQYNEYLHELELEENELNNF